MPLRLPTRLHLPGLRRKKAEKPADGIRKFAADIVKLEKLIATAVA